MVVGGVINLAEEGEVTARLCWEWESGWVGLEADAREDLQLAVSHSIKNGSRRGIKAALVKQTEAGN